MPAVAPGPGHVLDEIREEGGEPWRYQAGRLGVLLDQGGLPRGLLDQFAWPSVRTIGYRVCEDILRPGLPFHVLAVPGELDGQPMMARRYKDVWTISAGHMPVVLAHGGKRAKAWAVRFGLAGIALFAASALLLIKAGPARLIDPRRAGRETRAGLDHLAFAVGGRAELDVWAARLGDAAVVHSPVTPANSIPGAAVLVFRDPDSIQLELFAEPPS